MDKELNEIIDEIKKEYEKQAGNRNWTAVDTDIKQLERKKKKERDNKTLKFFLISSDKMPNIFMKEYNKRETMRRFNQSLDAKAFGDYVVNDSTFKVTEITSVEQLP